MGLWAGGLAVALRSRSAAVGGDGPGVRNVGRSVSGEGRPPWVCCGQGGKMKQ